MKTNHLICLFIAMMLTTTVSIMAKPDIKEGKRYHIVCQQFPAGCVADGNSNGQQTPLTCLTQRTTDEATLWIFIETASGQYQIRNAKTGQYVTYDGVYEGANRRYVSMTAQPQGSMSLWTLTSQSGAYFTIRSVGKNDHLWDVRVSSYVVGTYSNSASGNTNQLFALYDEAGTPVTNIIESHAVLENALSDLTLGGYSAAYTTDQGGYYLYPTGADHFGTDLPLTVSYTAKEGWGNLHIDGTEVKSGETYTFNEVTGGKYYTLSITKSDGTILSARLTFTSLTVVSLYGTFSNNYTEGSIVVQEPDTKTYTLQRMKAKWRGGITNGNDKHKRNYHVKFLDADGEKMDQKFFGLRNDNSWLLEACQVDMLRIRNRMLTNLWNDYAVKPYYADREPKALSGSRGDFVELILNEEYRGIYCLTEAIDRKQMKLVKYDEDNKVMHGQLWKSKDWSYAVFMGHNSNSNSYPMTSPTSYNNNSETWDQYEVKYPEIDDVSPTDWKPLYDAVNMVCTANDATFRNKVGELFDLPVVIDYYILMETTLATDNHGKNMYFAIYDQQESKKITLAVWDMDASMGQRWSDAYYHSTLMQPEQNYATYITNNEHGDYNLFRRLRLTNADDFNMQVRLRYRDLREKWLKTDDLIARFEQQIAVFKTAGADQREYKKWSGDSDVAGKTLNFDTELTYLKNWITKRMNYLDKTRFDIESLPPSAIHTVSMDPGIKRNAKGVFTLDGRRVSLSTDEQLLKQLPPGLYLVNGQKVIVGK